MEHMPVCTRTRTGKIQRLKSAVKKMNWSCHQICLLDKKLRGVATRQARAMADGNSCFLYNLKIHNAVVEGLKNVLHEYALDRAEEIAELRRELVVTVVNTNSLTGYYGYADYDEWVARYNDEDDDDDDMDYEEYAAHYNAEEDVELVTTDDGEDSSDDDEGGPDVNAMEVEEYRR